MDHASESGPARATPLELAALVVAPAALLMAHAAHPYLAGRLPNSEAVAEEVVAGTTRWAAVHLGASVASALLILAFLALRRVLRRAGEDRLSSLGLPFVILGSVFYAVLPGMEFAPLAAAERGATTAEVAATQDAIAGWFTAVLAIAGVTFAIGVVAFARAITSASVGGLATARVAAVALVAVAVSRLLPLAVAQFYVQGLAAVVGLWLLAYALSDPQVGATAKGTRPALSN